MKFGSLEAGCVSRFRAKLGGQISLHRRSVCIRRLPWQRPLRSNSTVKVLGFYYAWKTKLWQPLGTAPAGPAHVVNRWRYNGRCLATAHWRYSFINLFTYLLTYLLTAVRRLEVEGMNLFRILALEAPTRLPQNRVIASGRWQLTGLWTFWIYGV